VVDARVADLVGPRERYTLGQLDRAIADNLELYAIRVELRTADRVLVEPRVSLVERNEFTTEKVADYQ
jgi:hypothetical protein